MNRNIQYRNFNIEYRFDDTSNPDSRTVEGYGSVFETPSADLGFIETISRSAITEDTIKNSDVFAMLNHDTDKILARSRYGEGSLELSLDEKGLHYRFEAPKTNLGDELLEHLNRREITSSSFAFTVAEDIWEKRDGQIYRTITKIDRIYDVSPVFEPAYPAAECHHRNLPSEYEEELKKLEIRMEEKPIEKPIEKPMEDPKDELTPDENRMEDDPKEKPNGGCRADDESPEETIEETTEDPMDEPNPDDNPNNESNEPNKINEKPSEDDSEEERKNKLNKSKMEKIEKRFNLVAELRNAMETGKTIDLGAIENRGYSVTDEGADIVDTDLYNILEPLRAKNVLMQAGAKYMTGLVGNVQIPIMSGGNVAWASEKGAATDGSGSFTSVTLSPKRLTGKFPISLQLLEQDSIDVENVIRQDIINAINDKLEESILKTSATVQGDFDNLAAKLGNEAVSVATYTELVQQEGGVEEENVYGDCKYIVAPSAKSVLRSMIKGTNGTGMVMEAGQIDGIEVLSTSHVSPNNFYYGDFSNVIIGSWGNVQLDVVRDVESLANGCVTVVVNAFFDCKIARPEAFVYETVNTI